MLNIVQYETSGAIISDAQRSSPRAASCNLARLNKHVYKVINKVTKYKHRYKHRLP